MWMKRVVTMGVLCALATACQSQAGYVSSTGPPEDYRASVKAQLKEQLLRWRAHKFNHYDIIYTVVEDPTGSALLRLRSVKIRNNSVLDTRCATGGCPSGLLGDLRFIPELFELIETLPDECLDQVQFNREFDYPEFVSANCASHFPRPFTIRISTFLPNP